MNIASSHDFGAGKFVDCLSRTLALGVLCGAPGQGLLRLVLPFPCSGVLHAMHPQGLVFCCGLLCSPVPSKGDF